MSDGEIALIPRGRRMLSKEEKQEYAKKRAEDELRRDLHDTRKVRYAASKFEEIVARERAKMGLS